MPELLTDAAPAGTLAKLDTPSVRGATNIYVVMPQRHTVDGALYVLHFEHGYHDSEVGRWAHQLRGVDPDA